jgi:hypothetical protein
VRAVWRVGPSKGRAAPGSRHSARCSERASGSDTRADPHGKRALSAHYDGCFAAVGPVGADLLPSRDGRCGRVQYEVLFTAVGRGGAIDRKASGWEPGVEPLWEEPGLRERSDS